MSLRRSLAPDAGCVAGSPATSRDESVGWPGDAPCAAPSDAAAAPSTAAAGACVAESLLDEVTELVCVTTAEGRITRVNRAWRRALGYTAAEAEALRPGELVAGEHRARHEDAARRLLRGETLEAFETALVAKDGRRVVCRGRVVPVMAPGPTGARCVGTHAVFRDLTAEREAEAGAAASEAELRAVLAAMHDVALVIDREGTYVRVLPTAPELLYRPSASLVGRRLADVFEPARAEAFLRVVREALDRREVVETEYSLDLPAMARDAPTWFAASVAPLGDDAVLWVARDVTARRRAEDALRASRARLRAALEGGRYAFLGLHAVRDEAGAVVDFDIVQVNAHAAALVGLTLDEAERLVGQRMCDVLPFARPGGHFARCVEVVESRAPVEYDFETADPRLRARWLRAQVVPLDDGGVAFLARDVTPKKRAALERALLVEVTRALSEAADLRSAVGTALEAMCRATGWEYGEAWVVTSDGARAPRLAHARVWHAPDDAGLARFAELSAGFTFESGRGLPGAAWAGGATVVMPDLERERGEFLRRPQARDAGLHAGVGIPVTAATGAGGRGDVVAVLAFHTRDGGAIDDGRVALVSAVAAQVGEVVRRKMAEDALARERAFLGAVLDSVSAQVTVCGPDGRLVLFNRAARDVFGGTEDATVPPERWGGRYHVLRADGVTPARAEDYAHVRARATQADVDGVELVYAPPGRPRRSVVVNARVLRGPAGEILGTVAAEHDVTARKAAEAALRASEERYRALLATLPLLVYVIEPDPPYTPLYVSPGATTLGHTQEEWAEGLDAWMRALYPEDREWAVREAVAALAERRPLDYEYRIVAKDGTVRWVHDRAALLPASEGRPAVWQGMMLDITARREAEQALRESEARVRGAVEASLDALYVYRALRDASGTVVDYQLVDCNARATALLSTPRDELLAMPVGELFPLARERGLLAAYDRVMETGEPAEFEYETADPRTTARWVRLQVVRVGDGLAVTARDVTEQRQAEETLRSLALVDELTGVHNRRGFMALAEREWQRALRERRGAVLVYIDLDGFKAVNDGLGHAEGDRALRAAADVLRAAFRGADVIGRLGGDEFAVLAVPAGSAAGASSADIDALERRIRDRIALHLASANADARAAGRRYDLAMSVGTAAVRPGDGEGVPSLAALMIEADERLYEAKRARRG